MERSLKPKRPKSELVEQRIAGDFSFLPFTLLLNLAFQDDLDLASDEALMQACKEELGPQACEAPSMERQRES